MRCLLLCITLAIGAVLGGVTTGVVQQRAHRGEILEMKRMYEAMPDNLGRSFDTLLIVQNMGILNALRDGRTNSVIETTEVDVISTLDRLCENTTMEVLMANSNDVRTFKKVAEYFGQYPLNPTSVRFSQSAEKLLRLSQEVE